MSAESWVPSPAARPIWQLASGYASARRRRHPLWMLEAYFDDSGNGHGPVFVLAGWLSTAERWAAFNEEWQSVLDENPAIRPFKMKQAMAPSGVWRRMSDEGRYGLLDRMHSAVMSHAMRAFACVVHRDAFDEMIHEGLEVPGTAYWLAFMGVVHQTMDYHRETGLTDKVGFVFDRQMHEWPRAYSAFLGWRQNHPSLARFVAGTPREETDDDVLPLQAADYLVWQVRRRAAAMQSGIVEARHLMVRPPTEDEPTGAEGLPLPNPEDIPLIVDEWDRARLRSMHEETRRMGPSASPAVAPWVWKRSKPSRPAPD